MRLHQLSLRAFGPFAAEQSIDFEPLGAGGLFLLDGPTGAGKSTVLDAITFALYGPGEGGGWGRLHSHFAPAGVEPKVQLEFSLRGVRQRITRSPEYDRPKRRGEGTVRERASVHLERFEQGRWVSRSANKAEVGDMLAVDLGLTREQFTQVVLLPQGEFMRFLRAGDDDRRTLLTRLFGTGVYDRITDELDRRRRLVSGDVEAAARRLRSRVAAAGQEAGLDGDEQDELADAPDRSVRLARLGADLDSAARNAEAAALEAVERLADCRAAATTAAAHADRMRRLVRAGQMLAAHELTVPRHEEAAAVLRAAERAEPVRPLLAALDDTAVALTGARAELPDDQVDTAPNDWSDRAARLADQASSLAHLVADEARRPELAEAAEAARARCAEAVRRAAELSARADALPGELAAADTALAAAAATHAGLDPLSARAAALRDQCAAAEDLIVIESEVDAASAARERAVDGYTAASDDYFRVADARLANMAAELAAALADGEPCGVCGSREHPAPARPGPYAPGADEVRAARARRERAERDRDQTTEALAELQSRRATLRARAGDATVPDARAELASVEHEIAQAQAAGARRAELAETKARLEREAAGLADDQRALAAECAATDAAAVATSAALAAVDAALVDARAGYATVVERRQALREGGRQAEQVAASLVRLADLQSTHDAAVARAYAEALATGFADLDRARAAVLTRARIDELRAQVAGHAAELAALQAAVTATEFAELDPRDSESVELAAHDAADALAVAEQLAGEAAIARRTTADRSARFGTAGAEVVAAEAEHARLAEAAAPVIRLANLAKGVAGQRRVRLTSYVLRHWFEQVVAAANVRLLAMSGGRYELVRVDEGATRSERAGLTVLVLDRHTGEQRSARSLSGGETFYTSLALALGLADVVRAEAGGVDLDTLFIDEGFGSLDADTLDQVMGVIDELRDRGRTVGIVSHVSELKDRIAERIEVRRLPDGSSALSVVA